MTVPAATEAAPTTATAVAPAPAVPAAPAARAEGAAAAVPAPPKAPARQTTDQVLAAFDAEFEAVTAKTKAEMASGKDDAEEPVKEAPKPKPKEAAPGEEKKAGEEEAGEEEAPAAQDGEWEEGVVPPSPEEALPSKERSALKAIKDPEMRRAFARSHYLTKAFDKSGMRLSMIPKYLAVAPTPEILEERVQRASQLDAFVDEFQSEDPKAIYRVAEVLRQTSPNGWTGLVDAIIDNIHTVRPEKLRPLGDKFLRAVISNMRAKANEDDDLVLADHADGVEAYLGLKTGARAKGGRDETRLDPDVKRRLDEADEISRREKQREAEAVQQAYQAFNGVVVKTATTEGVSFIKDWIVENCAAYSDEAKAELFDRMAGSVLSEVQGNAHVAKTLQRLIDDGSGDEAHQKRCVDFLVRTSRSVFVNVAPRVLDKFQRVFGQAAARRTEKVVRALSSRDIGSTGAPAMPRETHLTGKGKHPDDVLKEFDALG